MRIAAGILMIIGGFLGGSFWFGISEWFLPSGFLSMLIRLLPVFLAVIGGIFALKRTRWGWALTGAICSLLLPFTGIPALILLIKSKSEFE
jgi:hypothetical protein